MNSAVKNAGLNLQKDCHRGIIMFEGHNKPLTIQVTGRLWRLGQEWPVHFTVLRVKGTYYDVLQDKACRKYAEQLANECQMPPHCRLQRLFAGEIIKEQFALPVNPYVYVMLPPTSLADYSSKEILRAGEFVSCVVRKLIEATPTEADVAALGQEELDRRFASAGRFVARAVLKFAAAADKDFDPDSIRIEEMRNYAPEAADLQGAGAPFWDNAFNLRRKRQHGITKPTVIIVKKPEGITQDEWDERRDSLDRDAVLREEELLHMLQEMRPPGLGW